MLHRIHNAKATKQILIILHQIFGFLHYQSDFMEAPCLLNMLNVTNKAGDLFEKKVHHIRCEATTAYVIGIVVYIGARF